METNLGLRERFKTITVKTKITKRNCLTLSDIYNFLPDVVLDKGGRDVLEKSVSLAMVLKQRFV